MSSLESISMIVPQCLMLLVRWHWAIIWLSLVCHWAIVGLSFGYHWSVIGLSQQQQWWRAACEIFVLE